MRVQPEWPKSEMWKIVDGDIICHACERPATKFFMNYNSPFCDEHFKSTAYFMDIPEADADILENGREPTSVMITADKLDESNN
jgi:hypothetical protein